GFVVRHVQFVRHHLTEGGAGALAEIGLSDVKRRSVVLTDHDPRIELPEIGVRIQTRRLRGCRSSRLRCLQDEWVVGRSTEAHNEKTKLFQKIPARGGFM